MIEKTTNTSNEGNENIENGKRKYKETVDGHNTQKRIKGLYRQPTADELNRLYETEKLFNSNLFRLQIEEILEEVKVSEKVVNKFQKWFDIFKSQLLNIPENDDEYNLSEKTLFKELKVKLPVAGDLRRTKCNFKFYKFTDVEIVGSYAVGSAINSELCVDLQITVPAETYTKNDSINYKYHKKRAAYLAYIASYLKNMECVKDLEYSWQDGLDTKPFLIFKPNSKLGNYVNIKLFLNCDSNSFKLHRLDLSRNNLRESWFFDDGSNEDNSTKIPTPYYNASILYDLTCAENNNYLKEVLGKEENLKQAIILLKIWLRQRNLNVSGYIISMYVAHMLKMRRINNMMSSYQIVRNVWMGLKHSQWDTEGFSMCKETDTFMLEEFLQHFPVVFLGKSSYYNICWQMSLGTYNALKRESGFAIELLDNMKINSFIPLFMTTYNPLLQFDNILRFKDLSAVKDAMYSKATVSQKLNYGTDILAYITNELYTILSRGLDDRVELIQPITKNKFSWQVKKSLSNVKNEYCEDLYFGFVLNGYKALNHMIKGPSANLPEANEFRDFWSEKSGLRRFQDGSLRETCVWQGNSLSERRDVTKQIVEYLLQLKFGISTDTLYISSQLDSVIISKQYAPSDGCIGTGEEITIKVLSAFEALSRDLRDIKEIPLDITSVQGISSVFSYMDPFPSMARNVSSEAPKRDVSCLIKRKHEKDEYYKCPPYTPVYKVVIKLGHTGKWPGDLEAFRCLKAAFHNQISRALTKECSLATQSHPTHVDILKNGVVFRLEIVHSKEVTLLKRSIENGVVKHRDSDESIEVMFKESVLPMLRGALHGLYQKYPACGPTTTLLKRFLSSHLIDDYHFSHIIVELLVAHVFLNPEPYISPFSPLCGFMRVLNLLFTKDWNEILVVDFDNSLSVESIESESSANESPKPSMRIVTSCDGEMAGIWAKKAPTSNILARVVVLAKSAFNYIENCLMKEFKDNVLNSFIAPISGYDVTIHVWSELVPRFAERVDKRPALLPEPVMKTEDVMPVLDFNPVAKYVQELRSAYGEFALFFYDMYGGDTIAVLWKPDIKDYREFQIVNAHALKPITVKGEVQHVPNINAIIEDFKILGQGLVKDITVHRS